MPDLIFHSPPAKFRSHLARLKLGAGLVMLWLVSTPAIAQTTPAMGSIMPLSTQPTTMISPGNGYKMTREMKNKKPEPDAKKHDKKHHKDPARHKILPVGEEFSTLSEADAHCPAGAVEWASMGHSNLYHNSQSRYFGKTKHGVYACKAILDEAGFRLGR